MQWQFNVYGTKGRMEVISNPWLPDYENKALVYLDGQNTPLEISVKVEKSLYAYQIDSLNKQLMTQQFDGISLLDSLNNIKVLETWRQQIMMAAIQG